MIRVILMLGFVVFALYVLFGNKGESGANTVMGGEFRSLRSCLTNVESSSGFSLDVIVDEPDNVTGYLRGTKRNFACTKKETGTKGVYWDGWYES
ncbi:hypothetical protein [Marinobacterium litorale]|uniref:hypothetical protein n=1 Tax=Marinobacterium litorale TaxID=404770 RepID=UPI00041C221E|nr:hypothetical protein [Marinobacterium litorale]